MQRLDDARARPGLGSRPSRCAQACRGIRRTLRLGTDWPHPNHQGPIPDDGTLVDILGEIAPSEAARKAVLVDNPRRFYRFAPARKLT